MIRSGYDYVVIRRHSNGDAVTAFFSREAEAVKEAERWAMAYSEQTQVWVCKVVCELKKSVTVVRV